MSLIFYLFFFHVYGCIRAVYFIYLFSNIYLCNKDVIAFFRALRALFIEIAGASVQI